MLLQRMVGEWMQNTQDRYGGGGMKKDESMGMQSKYWKKYTSLQRHTLGFKLTNSSH